MPTYKNLLDILKNKTGQDAREYSRGYDGTDGMPSVVQQVNDVENKEAEGLSFKSYSPQEQAYNYGIYDSYYNAGPNTEYTQVPENLKRSKRDDTWLGYSDALNIEDRRAMQQSGAEQLANGIAKGVVIAGTTFIDGIVGTAAGIVNLAYQAANGDIERPADALFAFIDNPVSKSLQRVNEWAEKVMPNYYSDEQKQSPWYAPVNLFSANFVGDKFLKNTGFMLGAAYSGRVNAGMMSKAMAKKELREAFKGVVKNSAGQELTSASQIYKAYKTGDAFMDGVKLTEDLGKQAKTMANEEWALKVLGAMSAAAGEARIEAITNTDDYVKQMQQKIDADRDDALSRVRNEVISRNTTDNPTYNLVLDPETGNAVPVLTDHGRELTNTLSSEIEQRHQDASIQLQKDRAVMANNIFGLNMLVLTGTDLFTFGRFIAGGYSTNRAAKEYAKRSGKHAAGKLYEEQMKERNKDIAKAISVPFVEGPYEEMMQSSIATGAGYNASAKMNRFYGYKIDPEAEDDAVNTVNAILDGIRDTYSDPDKWEEGVIGALSSVVGIPGFVESRNKEGKVEYEKYQDKNGRTRYKAKQKFRMQGEFWDSLRDASEDAQKSKDLTAKLNEVTSDPEFVNKWQAYIRHKSLDSIKDAALTNGDPFAYKNADSDQIISDIIAFDKAGRIQDLFELIDENENITEDDIVSIVNATKDKKTNKSPYDNMLPSEVISKVKEHAEDFRNTLNKYIEVKNNLRQVYGTTMNDDYEEALTWAYLSIDDAEKRLKNLTEELIPELNDAFHVFSSLTGNQLGMNLTNLNDIYRFMFSGKTYEDFVNSVGKKSARNLDYKKLGKIIEETLRDKDKMLDLIELDDEYKNLTDKERANLQQNHDNALSTYMRAMELIELLDKDPSLHAISDLEMADIIKKMNDVGNLIMYKSEFLDMLAKLSNNPGAFNKDIVELQEQRLNDRISNQAQKAYDSLSDDMSQKDFNNAINTLVRDNQSTTNRLNKNNFKDQFFKLLKSSSKPRIKQLYAEYDKLESALNSLMQATFLDENDPNANIKGYVNMALTDLIEAEMPESVNELVEYVRKAAASVDNPIAYDYEKTLIGKISTTAQRREVSQNAVKEKEPKETPQETKKEKKKEEEWGGFNDDGNQQDVNGTVLDSGLEIVDNGNTGDTADGKVDPNENYRIVEDTISKLSLDELNAIIDEEKVPASIKDKASINIMKALAGYYKAEKDGTLSGTAPALSTDELNKATDKKEVEESEPAIDPESQGSPKIYNHVDGAVLKGVGITGFSMGALRGGLVKHLSIADGLNENIIRVSEILRNDFNTYDFLDSGALANIEKMYISKGSTTPLRFVFANKNEGRKYTDLHTHKEATAKFREKDTYNILLAVELTDEVRNSLSEEQKRQIREVQIDNVPYQIVGVVGKLDNDVSSNEAYAQIYSVNIASIDKQREENPLQDLFIGNHNGQPTFTTINKLYSGRKPKATSKVDIKKILDTSLGENVYFGVTLMRQKTGEIDVMTNMPDYLTKRDPSDIGVNLTPGMVFAFAQSADGTYSYIPVLMAFSDEIDFTADNQFINAIKSDVETLLNPTMSEYTKMTAKIDIMNAFRTGNTPFYFRKDENNSFHLAGRTITSWDDFVDLMSSKKFRVQFDYRALKSGSDNYINALIDSGAMYVNYSSLRSYNSSFTINALTKTGDPVIPKRKRIGQARKKYIVPTNFDVIMDGPNAYYSYTPDGIYDMSNGSLVTNPIIIARVQLQYYVKTGINPGLDFSMLEGVSNVLYEIPKSVDGTRDEMFFVQNVGSRVIEQIDKEQAEIYKKTIERENRIKESREQSMGTNGLKIYEGDDAIKPVKAQELTQNDLKVTQLSTTQSTEDNVSESKLGTVKKNFEQQALTRTEGDVSSVNTEITDNDRSLAKQIKELKITAPQIESYFERHGVSVSVAGLNKTAMAQTINRAIELNPELNVNEMISEITCGHHG